jgi:hypothetical protein
MANGSIVDMAGLATAMGKAQTCATCRFMWALGPSLVCRRFPPVSTIIMVPDPQQRVIGPGMQALRPEQICSLPQVQQGAWCGEWQKAVSA